MNLANFPDEGLKTQGSFTYPICQLFVLARRNAMIVKMGNCHVSRPHCVLRFTPVGSVSTCFIFAHITMPWPTQLPQNVLLLPPAHEASYSSHCFSQVVFSRKTSPLFTLLSQQSSHPVNSCARELFCCQPEEDTWSEIGVWMHWWTVRCVHDDRKKNLVLLLSKFSNMTGKCHRAVVIWHFAQSVWPIQSGSSFQSLSQCNSWLKRSQESHMITCDRTNNKSKWSAWCKKCTKQWRNMGRDALCCSSKKTLTHRMLSCVNFSAGPVHHPPWFALFHCRNQLMFCDREVPMFMCAAGQRPCVSLAVLQLWAWPWFNGASLRFNSCCPH